MSHRLKLNAIHFASSLEEEKALLEASQDTLESKSMLTFRVVANLVEIILPIHVRPRRTCQRSRRRVEELHA